MRKTIRSLAVSAALLGTSSVALAVDIGGLNLPLGPTFGGAQIYENVISSVGDTLSGYGTIDQFSSVSISSLCTDCELTYWFGDYKVTAVTPSEVTLTGGVIKFYLGFGSEHDFTTLNAGGSAGDLAEVTNGTLFLTLKGHAIDALGNTFKGVGSDIGTTSPSGFGSGLFDVDTSAGGIANSMFDSNGIVALFGGGPADIRAESSFSALNVPYPAECPGGAGCLSGTISFKGTVVPTPESYALMLAALGVLGFAVRSTGKSQPRLSLS